MHRTSFNDTLRVTLMGRPTIHGDSKIGEPFVPITPEERELIMKRLHHEDANEICTNCGSTKPQSYYDAISAIGCCLESHMVPTSKLLSEIERLRQVKSDSMLRALALDAFDVLNWARRLGMKKEQQLDQVVAAYRLTFDGKRP